MYAPVPVSHNIYYSIFIRRTTIAIIHEAQTLYLTQPLWTRHQTANFLNRSTGTLSVWDCTKRHNLRPIRIGNDVRYCPIYIKELAGKSFFKSEAEMKSNKKYLAEPLWDRKQTATYLNRSVRTLSDWDSSGRYDLRPITMCREPRYCPVYIRELAADIFFSPE